MINKREAELADQVADEFDEYTEQIRRHYEGMEQGAYVRSLLKRALEINAELRVLEGAPPTRTERLEHTIRTAADKLRMNDAAGALLTLECAMRK